ncbi:MAG: hypothetical protein ACW986_16935 [Promethearchaeota archaeon]|jgi:hypothetical protein
MKENENDKEKSFKGKESLARAADIENTIDNGSLNRTSFIPSNNLTFLINNLSNPRFLGSIHLKKEMNPNYNQVKELIMSDNQVKLTKSLKSTIFNPLTKILIISTVIFNIFWFTLAYLF